ncbi:hypothetical protein DMB95_07540 [Campylobacter sp. MIT 12-8780]|uniref:hypothetical protein n=1 Tax=unclassified Campylobacter TaxID=2593542 RepID=UPI00115C9F9F|nr:MULTISPECIES: hypothetical protein [unclassified Campylobacter]NDJ28096.1 hypothetical protein [Campylobacter sp. MIT 19-121]TQR40468.1 hypothetical protein DMB95_07540 [Campylobacter sp. MIT 12-8780]
MNDIPETIDQTKAFESLDSLINGLDCTKSTSAALITEGNFVYVNDKDIVETTAYNDETRIVFEETILRGGILRGDKYISDDMKFSFHFDENLRLIVTSVCKNTSITINNFFQEHENFGIRLRKKAGKELGFIYCNSFDVHAYIKAFKEIAPFISKRVFKDKDTLSKLFVNNYKSMRDGVLGPFYTPEDFVEAIDKISFNPQSLYLLNVAMIEIMSQFTKHNGLLKELYVISTTPLLDKFRWQSMVEMMKNLNRNIVKNTPEKKENQVKVHGFALGTDLDFLKFMCEDSGGIYTRVDSILEFKRSILTRLSDGVLPDPKELGKDAQIQIITPNKIYDPDDADNKN